MILVGAIKALLRLYSGSCTALVVGAIKVHNGSIISVDGLHGASQAQRSSEALRY
jgi:hypothetical protein